MRVIQLGGFGIDDFICSIFQEPNRGAAALVNDLYSARLRIDLAHLLGVAVFDTDHVYLLYVGVNKKRRSYPTEIPAVMAPPFDAHQFY